MREYDGVDGERSHGSLFFRQLLWVLGKLNELSVIGAVVHLGR